MTANPSDEATEHRPDAPKTKRSWSLIGVIIGLGMLAVGVVILCFNAAFAIHESGAVVSHVVGYEREQRCYSHQGCHENYLPKVAFTTADGTRVTATLRDVQPSSPTPNGTVLQIRYDTSDPSKVRTADADWWGTWGWPSLLVLFGGFIAWSCLPSRRSKAHPDAAQHPHAPSA